MQWLNGRADDGPKGTDGEIITEELTGKLRKDREQCTIRQTVRREHAKSDFDNSAIRRCLPA